MNRYIEKFENKIAKYNNVGLIFALLAFWASLVPSLIPRPWFMQALTCAVSMAAFYGIGVLVHKLYKHFRSKPLFVLNERAKTITYVALTATTVYSLIANTLYQKDVYTLTGQSEPASIPWVTSTIGVLVVSTLIALGFIKLFAKIGRFFRGVFRKINNAEKKHLHTDGIARTVIVGGLLVFAILFIVGAFTQVSSAIVNRIFAVQNSVFSEGYDKPTSPSVSGSDESLVPWETMGDEGRKFLAGRPTVEDISSVTGTEAQQPIRVYVGLEETTDFYEQASLAVKELERTNAFNREVILIAVPTGSGWVSQGSAKPLEFITNGNMATVAIQYSFYPSWLAMITEREKANESAAEIIRQVSAAIKNREEGENKPKLYVFGESLGSFGAENAIEDDLSLIDGIDGSVLVGPPGFNPLKQYLTDNRDPSSPSYSPVINDKEIYFAINTEQLQTVPKDARLIFMQNPTDPITKLQVPLIWSEPEWIDEQIEDGLTSDQFRWYPIVTATQLVVDMILALAVPAGYGHYYGINPAEAWSAMTGVELSQQQIDQMRSIVLE